ncbi:MAG: hypothetical protein RRA94_08810 [Bacteroidota bacterium]|nr:hypothetical protein [Bacteroidota bacterium]
MRSIAFFSLLIMLCAAAPATAQPIWVAAEQDHAISFEWQKPFYENSEGIKFLHSTFFFGYRVRTSEALTFLVDLPFSNFSTDTYDEFLLGNPYVGIALGSEDALISGDVGVRLPLADKEKALASYFASAADIDRLEAFATEAVPATGILRLHTRIHATKLGVRMHAGPSILVYMDDRGDEIMDVYLKYGFLTQYEDEAVLVQLGYTGVYTFRHQFDSREDQASSQIGLTVNADIGAGFWPGLLLRIPLDNHLGAGLDAVFGVNLMFVL